MKKIYTVLLALFLLIGVSSVADAKGGKKSYSSKSKSSSVSSKPKTVKVKGYTKKDGTYVAPHTRSAPTKKK